MYWWNVRKLAEDLREGRVDEKERFNYFLATFIGWSVAGLLFLHSKRSFSTDDVISVGVVLAVAVVGIILCYRVNRSGDNVDFIPRMICLGWPLSVMLAFFYLVLVGPWGGSEVIYLRILLEVFYFSTIYGHLVDIAQAKEGRILVEMLSADLSLGKAALVLLMFFGTAFVFAATEVYIAEHEGMEIIARLLGLSVTGLWLILLGWLFALLHKRSIEHALEG